MAISQDNDGNREVENQLRGFVPRAAEIDRDRLMFLAGAASVARTAEGHATKWRRTQWFWPASTVAMSGIAAALLVALVLRPEPPTQVVIRERIVRVPTEIAATPPQVAAAVPPPPGTGAPAARGAGEAAAPRDDFSPSYLRNRDLALAYGIDALQEPAMHGGGGAAPSTYRDLLQQLSPRVKSNAASFPALTWPRLRGDDVSM